MMTNLFSVFDPAVPKFLPISLFSPMVFFVLPFLSYWSYTTVYFLFFKKMINFIFYELLPFSKKTPHMTIFTGVIFLFIAFNNLSGNLAYVFPASAHMSFSATLAFSVWFIFFIHGWANNSTNLFIHLVPKGTPPILMPFMVIIETISMLIRPLTLAIRLSANIVAGHLLVSLMSEAYLKSPVYMHSSIANYLCPLMGLELAVAMIQAYVFSVLISLYAEESNN